MSRCFHVVAPQAPSLHCIRALLLALSLLRYVLDMRCTTTSFQCRTLFLTPLLMSCFIFAFLSVPLVYRFDSFVFSGFAPPFACLVFFMISFLCRFVTCVVLHLFSVSPLWSTSAFVSSSSTGVTNMTFFEAGCSRGLHNCSYYTVCTGCEQVQCTSAVFLSACF